MRGHITKRTENARSLRGLHFVRERVRNNAFSYHAMKPENRDANGGVIGKQAAIRSTKRSHNPKVAGSNPAPATKRNLGFGPGFSAFGPRNERYVKPVSNEHLRIGLGERGVEVDSTWRRKARLSKCPRPFEHVCLHPRHYGAYCFKVRSRHEHVVGRAAVEETGRRHAVCHRHQITRPTALAAVAGCSSSATH